MSNTVCTHTLQLYVLPQCIQHLRVTVCEGKACKWVEKQGRDAHKSEARAQLKNMSTPTVNSICGIVEWRVPDKRGRKSRSLQTQHRYTAWYSSALGLTRMYVCVRTSIQEDLTHFAATAAGLAMIHSSRYNAASQVLIPVVPPTTSEVDSFSTTKMLPSFCKMHNVTFSCQ